MVLNKPPHRLTTSSDVAKGASPTVGHQPDFPDVLVSRQPLRKRGRVGNLFLLREQVDLVAPRSVRGVGHDALANGDPLTDGCHVLSGETLFLVGVPPTAFGQKELGLQTTDVEQRQWLGRCGHEHHALPFTPRDAFDGRKALLELHELFVGVDEPPSTRRASCSADGVVSMTPSPLTLGQPRSR